MEGEIEELNFGPRYIEIQRSYCPITFFSRGKVLQCSGGKMQGCAGLPCPRHAGRRTGCAAKGPDPASRASGRTCHCVGSPSRCRAAARCPFCPRANNSKQQQTTLRGLLWLSGLTTRKASKHVPESQHNQKASKGRHLLAAEHPPPLLSLSTHP
jgi:hypothetical protein